MVHDVNQNVLYHLGRYQDADAKDIGGLTRSGNGSSDYCVFRKQPLA